MYLTHIVFSGGNIKGFVFLGVIRYLYTFNHLQHIKNVAGTSFGGIMAILIALRINVEDFEKFFLDYSNNPQLKINSTSNIHNIFTKLGMESARKYTEKLIEYVENKYNVRDFTFQEVSKKFGINLYINAFCVNTQKDIIFNIDDTPNVSIFDVATAAISIPIISQPVLIDGYYYCDSFFINNVISEKFKEIPPQNKLIVVCNVPYDIQTIPKHETIDPITYYGIIGTSMLNSVFEYSSKRHIDERTLEFKEIFPQLNNVITKKGLIQDFNQDMLETVILFGFNKTSQYIDKHYHNLTIAS